MKTSLKLGLSATFVVVLSFVLATGSPAKSTSNLGDKRLTSRELLEKWDGAQAFLALAELAEAQCPVFSRLLDRKKADIVTVVPTNAAIADYLRIEPATFDGLEIDDIVDAWPDITVGRDAGPRDLCRLLRRHFSRGKAKTIKELLNQGFFTTVNGEEIPVSIGQGGVNFDGKAPVTVRDVISRNGIIHFLDQTLAQAPAPPSSDVVQVFVTRGQTYPTRYTDGSRILNGLEGADFYCQDQAEDADLTGTWTAWMSDDDNDARERIPDGRYELVNGQLVAEDKEDLTDGFLETGIYLDQFGGINNALVWTGTNKNGTRAADNCSNWTDGNARALHGNSYANTTYPDWTETTVTGCNQGNFNLYCFGTTP